MPRKYKLLDVLAASFSRCLPHKEPSFGQMEDNDFITIPETNSQICIITEKNEVLPEISFPSSNVYQKNVNCVEYIFKIHEKVKLILHIENNTNGVFLDVNVDDYIDTTVQYLKDGIILQLSKLLFCN